ncbi:MAG: hypothetical protein ACRCXD_09860 [Luteolibacter sp.]
MALLTKKWGDALGGIKSEYTKRCTAVLMENQMEYLRREVLGEANTTTANAASYLKHIFPLIRRVFPNLIANELVSVQPMSGPVGGLFYYEVKYGTTKGKVTAGQKLVKDFNAYYTSEQIDEEIIGVGAGTTFASTLDFQPVRTSTVIVRAGSVSGTDNGSGAITGTGVTGTIDYQTGAVSVTFGTAVGAGVNVTAAYQYNSECNTNLPTINLDIELKEVRAKTRKLRANVCLEGADDLRALHGIEADSELVATMATEMSLEIDQEIIEKLRSAAELHNPLGYNISTVPSGISQVDHIRGLLTQISLASNRIHTLSKRGPANFGVTSPAVSAYIEQLGTHGDYRPLFAAPGAETIAPAENPQGFQLYKMGTLQNKIVMYKDTYFPAPGEGTGSGQGDILLGYKGSSWLDAGAVWAPYVPLYISQSFMDPDDGVMKRLAYTRYAFEIMRPEFYRRVRVTGL